MINLANADVLSHTGNIQVVAKGIEFVDQAVGLIYEKVLEKNGTLIITADHGNAESLIYGLTGEKETKHNLNPVPFYLISEQLKNQIMPEEVTGILSDVAPTILEFMNLSKPVEMTGQSLLQSLQG